MKKIIRNIVSAAAAVIASASMVISASANTYIDKDGNVTHEQNYTDFMVYVQDSDGNYKLTYDYVYMGRCELYGDVYCTPANGWFAYNDGIRIELGHEFSPTKRYGKDSEGRDLYYNDYVGYFVFDGEERFVYGYSYGRDPEGRRVYYRNDVGYYAYDKNGNIYYGNEVPDDVIYDP